MTPRSRARASTPPPSPFASQRDTDMKTKPLNLSAPDLTQHPPRSPRVRLGGYVIFARALDKCRAALAGTSGEYHFDCPLDRKFFTFTGISPKAFEREVTKGRGDGRKRHA